MFKTFAVSSELERVERGGRLTEQVAIVVRPALPLGSLRVVLGASAKGAGECILEYAPQDAPHLFRLGINGEWWPVRVVEKDCATELWVQNKGMRPIPDLVGGVLMRVKEQVQITLDAVAPIWLGALAWTEKDIVRIDSNAKELDGRTLDLARALDENRKMFILALDGLRGVQDTLRNALEIRAQGIENELQHVRQVVNGHGQRLDMHASLHSGHAAATSDLRAWAARIPGWLRWVWGVPKVDGK